MALVSSQTPILREEKGLWAQCLVEITPWGGICMHQSVIIAYLITNRGQDTCEECKVT